MSESIKGFAVVLEKDLTEDGAKALADAISQMRYVESVEPILAEPIGDMLIETRIRRQIVSGVIGLIFPRKQGDDPR